VNRGDRLANICLLVLAVAAWGAVVYLFMSYPPTESATSLLAGGLLLGTAVGLTLAPVFWLVAFVRNNRIAYRGSWWRAGRRAALCGLVVSLFVLIRGQGMFSVPLMLFIVAMAVLVELTLSLRG
jgi:hypothetical protein